ncbi:MAG: NAD-dependent epimerase/dehydratase family protein [Thermodesulfobacteriota bacterium]
MDFGGFEGKRIIITGGLGFIGSTLALRLVGLGAQVIAVDSLIPEYGGNLFNLRGYEDKVKINIADVRDEFSMSYLIQGQDYLFNLAGQTSHLDSMENPFSDLDINCRAQLFILEACRKFNPTVKVVYAGTRQVYGRPDSLPVNEEHPIRPVDVNGIHKMAGEWYHLLYNSVYGIRACALRLTNTYGPRMRIKDARQTFLGVWIRNLLEHRPIEIWGDGLQIRDFNYVDDAVQALLMVALSDAANGQVYNLGSPEHINLKDLAEMMVKVCGAGEYRIIPFPGKRKTIDIGDYYADFGKIRRDFRWEPEIGLEEGIEKTLNFYHQHLQHYL